MRVRVRVRVRERERERVHPNPDPNQAAPVGLLRVVLVGVDGHRGDELG